MTSSSGKNMVASGLTAFAGALMVLSGVWSIFVGISEIAKDKVFVSTPDYIYKVDLTGWGWIHLILGILVTIAGVCLFLGQTWARIVALFLAILSAFAQFLWLPYYPFWAVLIIGLDVLIVWALLRDPDTYPRV